VKESERCLLQVERARQHLRQAVDELSTAAHISKTEGLADGIDPRALSVARTNAETAELWAARAVE